MVSFTKTMIKKFFLYGIGGFLAFITNFFLIYFLTEILHIYYLISSIIGYSITIFINFLFQSFITFQIEKVKIKNFIFFFAHQIAGLFLFTLFMFLFTDIIKIYYLISFIITSLLVYIFNFSMSYIFVFKK